MMISCIGCKYNRFSKLLLWVKLEHHCLHILKWVSLTVVSLLVMLGSLVTVLSLVLRVLKLGILSEYRLWAWLSVFGSSSVDVSSTEREHCRRFFLRWCGRLLRQAGGFSRSGTKALFWPRWWEPAEHSPPEQSVTDTHVCASHVALALSSSDFDMGNLVHRMEELRLWERWRGLGSQKSELWRLASRLCWGLLNIIQYGGQDGSSPEEEESWGRCWLMKPLCSPVITHFSRLNSYCQVETQRTSDRNRSLNSSTMELSLYHYITTF